MNQIFQTESATRWQRVKWSLRVLLFMAAILVAVFITMFIIEQNPSVPFKQDYKSVVTASKPYLKNNKLASEYKGFRNEIKDNKPQLGYAKVKAQRLKKIKRYGGSTPEAVRQNIDSWWSTPAGIRSAFYVNWDPMAYASLKQHIRKLNLVLPEWYFLNPKTGELESRIDGKSFELMKKSGVPVMPLLTNNYNQNFNAATVSMILHNPAKRHKLIRSLRNECVKHGFIGINIDFEELAEKYNEPLTGFMAELSSTFHAADLYVTQDIIPFNEDFDVKSLAQYNDFLFLMAYDEHSLTSEPGPLSSQRWIEAAVDQAAKDIPSEKLILGMAAYGYDWTSKGDENQSLSYQDALSVADAVGTLPRFDEDTYNLDFSYTDNNHETHTIYMTDAVTQFNVMRFGVVSDLAGFGVWRLGTEDSRLWHFYHKDLSYDKVAESKVKDLEHLSGSKSVSYVGTGEVLDVIGTPRSGRATVQMDSSLMLISAENYQKLPACYELRKFGQAKDKQLLITFDDGPDSRWTPKILNILDKYKVKAAFFMVGLQMEKNLPIVQDVARRGNLIGNHTFTHANVAENSPERTAMELKLTRLLLESITGNSTILFRAPYNADSDPTGYEEILPIVLARKENYLDVGESIDPEDWLPGITADEIFNRVVKGVNQNYGHIILLHDAGGTTREATIQALPRIIEYFQKRGYQFISLEQYLGKTHQQLMPPVPKGEEYYAMQSNLLLASLIYNIGDFVVALFIVFIILGFCRLFFMFGLTIKERRKARKQHLTRWSAEEAPLVSVIVPAYNEEVTAVSSLNNLLKQDYPNFDIIFVDDGSKDETYKRVSEAFAGNDKIKLLTKPNGGKATALNFGIENTQAEYVVCIDADTKLSRDAISILMSHFKADAEEKVGAVAGNVKVGNQRNFLTRWQAIEYTTSQNFDRQAYAAINAITVVPGAIGAFRRKAIQDAGGLTTDTLAEDCDLTIRIIRTGYLVENENHAVAMTEAPEKVKQFMKQRTRWSFGVMQTFWKHRDAMFHSRYKGLGMWALPNMLLFQFIIPTFSPLADILMILGLFSGNAWQIFIYYLLFTLVDSSVSLMAYLFEREKLGVLLWIIPQRFFYRWMMYLVLFRSYKKALKGELQLWGVLKRTGNVNDL